MPRPHNVGVGVAVIVFNNMDEVLLGLRKGAHAAGLWSAPGGWVDATDTDIRETCQRELLEEVNLAIDIKDIYQLNTTIEHHADLNITCVTCYHSHLLDSKYIKDIKLMEPNKCEEWRWFSTDDLPTNLFPNLKEKIISMRSF